MEERILDKIVDNCMREFNNGEYEKSLNSGLLAYELLSKTDTVDYKDEYFMYLDLVYVIRACEKLNRLEDAVRYETECKKYIDTESKKAPVCCTMARVYAQLNDLENANTNWDYAITYYEKIKDINYLPEIYNAKAWYTKDEKVSLKAIELLDRNNTINLNLLINFYDTLFNIYELTNQHQKMLNTYDNILLKSRNEITYKEVANILAKKYKFAK